METTPNYKISLSDVESTSFDWKLFLAALLGFFFILWITELFEKKQTLLALEYTQRENDMLREYRPIPMPPLEIIREVKPKSKTPCPCYKNNNNANRGVRPRGRNYNNNKKSKNKH